MRPVEEFFSIVIVGSWNHRIFSENWVAENLAKDAASKVALAFPIGDPFAPNRLEFEDILMFVASGNIRLTPKSLTVEGLNYCKDIAQKIIQTLSHTPISAFGINYRFEESDGLERIWEKSGIASQFETIDDLGMSLSNVSVTKQFVLNARTQLNHTVSSGAEGPATFDFNFHHGSEDAKSALELLGTDVVTEYYQNVKSFFRSYYDVELPE